MNVYADITDPDPDIAAIGGLIERCAQGFRDMNLDAIMACHTDDVVCFDCHSQFEARGAEAVRTFLAACLPHMVGPVVHRIHELAVAADGDVGFAHYHLESSCRDRAGAEHGGWLRITLGVRREGGDWKASHAHISAPFNPMTGKTMFGLPREANPFSDGSDTCCAS